MQGGQCAWDRTASLGCPMWRHIPVPFRWQQAPKPVLTTLTQPYNHDPAPIAPCVMSPAGGEPGELQPARGGVPGRR